MKIKGYLQVDTTFQRVSRSNYTRKTPSGNVAPTPSIPLCPLHFVLLRISTAISHAFIWLECHTRLTNFVEKPSFRASILLRRLVYWTAVKPGRGGSQSQIESDGDQLQ